MGKRSPILGYNHNVRYRGLVFHVQTEDSGVLSPHLFTHLFHHGVIVSTRKLVYDAGSAEESIKSLMQAQHKAVLKDLRRGHFDDKIDSYLGGTPGLLPRGAEDPGVRPGEAELATSPGTVQELANAAATEVLPTVIDELSAPVLIFENTPPPRRPSPLPSGLAGREPAAPPARASAPVIAQAPVVAGTSGAYAAIDTTLPTDAPAFEPQIDPELADIEIQLEIEDAEPVADLPRRQSRDTDMQLPAPDQTMPMLGASDDHTRPTIGAVNEEARRAASVSDGIPGVIRPVPPAIPPPPDSRRLGDRPSTINAATLPPARPISRPPSRPSMAPPPVVARPPTGDDRSRRESDPAEVYSPAPPSAELPAAERPGQYAQHKKGTRPPTDAIKDRPSGAIPMQPAPARPARLGSAPAPRAQPSVPTPARTPTPIPHEPAARSTPSEPIRAPIQPPVRGTPAPVAARPAPSSGVVMTRPAVIVGAPAKSVGTMPRIRKAREDEGRGFGQGLISEKSLDEVILAYLSEDADDK